MKSPAFISRRLLLASLGAVSIITLSALAAPTNAPATKGGSAPAGGKSAPVAISAAESLTNIMDDIPKSVFVVPTNVAAGKDPFFPHSQYPYVGSQVTPKATVKEVTVDLTLNGVSGTEDKPLAIINNRTMGIGDFSEFTAGKVRVGVKLMEVNLKTGTAVITKNGQRQVLQLKQR